MLQALAGTRPSQTHARVANATSGRSNRRTNSNRRPGRSCASTRALIVWAQSQQQPASASHAVHRLRLGHLPRRVRRHRPCARCSADESVVAKYVEVEVALAAAEAKAGVIPQDAADAIKRSARADAIDLAKLKQETDLVGYPIVGVVHQLAKQCGDAGRYVHWGATTQDIMDTATVLQIRDALALVEADLAAIEAALAGARAEAPRHGDGGPHASPARPAGDLRLQGRRLARHDRPSPPAPEGADAARPGRPVRGRRRHAGLARRQGPRRARRADAGAGPRPPAHPLARRARRFCRDGRLPRSRDGHARQDRHRRHADDADRGGGSLRAVRRRAAAHPRPCRRSATRSRAS